MLDGSVWLVRTVCPVLSYGIVCVCVAHPHDRTTFTGGHQLIGLYANGLNLFCDESLMRTVLSGTLYTYYRYLFHTHTHTGNLWLFCCPLRGFGRACMPCGMIPIHISSPKPIVQPNQNNNNNKMMKKKWKEMCNKKMMNRNMKFHWAIVVNRYVRYRRIFTVARCTYEYV